jgi:SAM-dependent methyltransferase
LISFPNPSAPSTSIKWNGETFDFDDKAVRVLAYDLSSPGWTNAPTPLHEELAGSELFIDVASRRHAVNAVAGYLSRSPSLILEFGVSSGFLLRDLIAQFPKHCVVGADYTLETLEALGQKFPNIPLLQFDLTQCPLPDAFADIVVVLNVLEHIKDDRKAAAELFRTLRPGGVLIIEVPAGSKLFDVYDRAAMHHRRYDMPDLRLLLQSVGFYYYPAVASWFPALSCLLHFQEA